jgi:hypothetical protein
LISFIGEGKSVKIIDYMIKKGLFDKRYTKEGELVLAGVRSRNIEIVKHIVESCGISKREGDWGLTQAHKYEYLDIIEYLTKLGYKPTIIYSKK